MRLGHESGGILPFLSAKTFLVEEGHERVRVALTTSSTLADSSEGNGLLDTWPNIPTLKAEVSRGDAAERTQQPWQQRRPIKVAPILLIEAMKYIRGCANLSTVAEVSRYVSRSGARVLQSMDSIPALQHAQQQAFQSRHELLLQKLASAEYQFDDRLGIARKRFDVQVFTWVGSVIADLAHDTGLPPGTVLTLALAAGLGQDDDWLPLDYRRMFRQETHRFRSWLVERVAQMTVA